MKKGFTLIELLVVVLIIGILSAVALPQYQVAVAKARFTQAMVMARPLHEAQKRCYLANGEYCRDFDSMDISLPANGTTSFNYWGSEDHGMMKWQSNDSAGLFCEVELSSSYVVCGVDVRGGSWYNVPRIVITEDETIYCQANSKTADGDSISHKVCKSMGGVKVKTAANDSGNSSYYTRYALP